jgi:uncharacterized protein (DUF1800 family)
MVNTSSADLEPVTRVGRRELIGLGVAAAVLSGCAPLARRFADHPTELPLPNGDIHPGQRLLNRAGFGPRPGDLARLHLMGWDAYLRDQLSGAKTESIGLRMQLQRQDVEQISDPDIEDLPQGEVIRQLQQNAILRAVYGENQLHERMADLWTNHFNVYVRKGDSAFRKGFDERDVIRKHALGTFPDLLRASAHSVAMLAYLDNPQNLDRHPNENYARELMELHTLGVGGGYTQKDVQEVARCFTGWTIETRFLHAKGTLRFDPDRHDVGAKLVLGHVIPAGGGPRDIDAVLDILLAHPSVSRFVAKKLVTYFYGEEDARLIEKTAAVYRSTGGDVPSMVGPLLQPDVLADAPPKIKRPFDLIASAVRATGGDTDGDTPVLNHLVAMGEPVYQWPMPDGYPTRAASWAAGMLPRWNFAHAFSHGQIAGTTPGTPQDLVGDTLGERAGSASKISKMGLGSSAQAMTLCLAAPEFQWS